MHKTNTETFYPANQTAWRKWLKRNHSLKDSVWIIFYKKGAGKPTIGWSEAVDEALCFGWIDSKRVSLDNEKFKQFFSKRKPRSMWSKINKEKVRLLIKEGLMTAAGFKSIEIARKNGSWTMLETVDKLKIPPDLLKEFSARPGSRRFFLSLSESVRKRMLLSLVTARRKDTRQKRITEIAEFAEKRCDQINSGEVT